MIILPPFTMPVKGGPWAIAKFVGPVAPFYTRWGSNKLSKHPYRIFPEFNTKLSVFTPERVILSWVNRQLEILFPSTKPICGLVWCSYKHYVAAYYPDHKLIKLNRDYFPDTLDVDYFDHKLKGVLLHEICHHVQTLRYGGNVLEHGKEFRELVNFVNGKLGGSFVSIFESELREALSGRKLCDARGEYMQYLFLTKSSNRHEVYLAASRYFQYTCFYIFPVCARMEPYLRNLPRMIKRLILVLPKAKDSKWLINLATTVGYIHGCMTDCLVDSMDLFREIYMYGCPLRISQSYNLFNYLVDSINETVKNEKSKDPYNYCSEHWWFSFRDGITLKVMDSILENHPQSSKGELEGPIGLISKLHPKNVCHGFKDSSKAFNDGYLAGEKISILARCTLRDIFIFRGTPLPPSLNVLPLGHG